MRGKTKAERDADKDRKLEELIEKSRQLAIDAPEVAQIKREARANIERRRREEHEKQVQTLRELEEERALQEEQEQEIKRREDVLIQAQIQRNREAATKRAARIAEQRVRDAALAAEIRETEAKLEEQKRAHETIAKRTRSSQGFKLAGALNDEWAAKVDSIASNRGGDSDTLATTERGTEIRRVSLERVLGIARRGSRAWLDDDAVNAFILGFVDAKNEAAGWDKRTSKTPPLYACLNSNWFPSIRQKGPASLKNWARRQKIEGQRILHAHKIFMPVNTGVHWTLVIVDPKDKKIQFLDSMDASGVQEIRAARAWLEMELGSHYIAADWSEERSISQQQNNSDDCGVFTCYNALASAMDLPFKDVAANKMPNARKQMAAILLNGGFSGIFKL